MSPESLRGLVRRTLDLILHIFVEDARTFQAESLHSSGGVDWEGFDVTVGDMPSTSLLKRVFAVDVVRPFRASPYCGLDGEACCWLVFAVVGDVFEVFAPRSLRSPAGKGSTLSFAGSPLTFRPLPEDQVNRWVAQDRPAAIADVLSFEQSSSRSGHAFC